MSFFSLETAYARPYRAPEVGVWFDLPEGWTPVGQAELSNISFSDADRKAVLQLFLFPPERFDTSAAIADHVVSRLGAGGDIAAFDYNGADAVFATLEFHADAVPVHGYGFFVGTESGGRALIVFTPSQNLDDMHDQMISAMDSYAGSEEERLRPGPVSQFLFPASAQVHDSQARLDIAGTVGEITYDHRSFSSAMDVIDREARLLAASRGEDTDTWKRFYRVIFRDNYERLAELSRVFRRTVPEGADERTIAESLLRWVQGWEYMRPGGVADLLPPLQGVVETRGDCDTRGLVFNILSAHLGLDAVLLVSSVYGHSVSGVAVPGPGARMEESGTSYVIAETTEDVALGLIASDMADPRGWIVVDLFGGAAP